jgi:hypothetical protein
MYITYNNTLYLYIHAIKHIHYHTAWTDTVVLYLSDGDEKQIL